MQTTGWKASILNQQYLLLILIPCVFGFLFVMTEQNKIYDWQAKTYDHWLNSEIQKGNVVMKDGIPYLNNEATE